jgi:2-polyprenyl-3-methyl-5-hydroxy-6-metoxy-1,4-benzoquinol methylase
MTDRFTSQWQANADVFAQLINGKGTPHHREILNPCIERLMGEVEGCCILDAGCGEGYLSRFYAKKGAEVVGVDFSPALIELCQTHPENTTARFQVGNLCKLDNLTDSSFDIILCNLVLLNLECLKETLYEFYRLLRPKGVLIFSVVHPAFNVYGPGHWELGEKDMQSGRRRGTHFVIDEYFLEKEFKVRWKTRGGEEFPQEFSFFHRTIGKYVNALLEAQFRLTKFEEPQPIKNLSFFDRERRIPFFLVIKAEKT